MGACFWIENQKSKIYKYLLLYLNHWCLSFFLSCAAPLSVFVPQLTNNNLITTATSATAGQGATKPPAASSNTPQTQFYSHHQTPINQNSPAKTLSPVTASSVTTSGGSSAGMSISGGRVLSSLSGIPISGRNQIGFSSTGLTNHHVSSSTIHKQL